MQWRKLFDDCDTKVVSKTDTSKGAYVPNKRQQEVLHGAGHIPRHGGSHDDHPFVIHAFDGSFSDVEATYYEAVRKDGRTPERRMGRQFVSEWMIQGDELLLGRIGEEVFAIKLNSVGEAADSMAGELVARLPSKALFDAARKGNPSPKTYETTTSVFQRSEYVVAAAIRRAQGKCEMPGCGKKPFHRADGSVYLEVHHIQPLAEDGPDILDNAAALCPDCHREQHHGSEKVAKRELLRQEIESKPLPD